MKKALKSHGSPEAITTDELRSPSVVIAAGEPWRFSAFFMKVSAAFLSLVLVTKLSRISPS